MSTPLLLTPGADSVIPTASFAALLSQHDLAPAWDMPAGAVEAPEATTILALRWTDGILMAGDRRATAGNVISHRRVKKVYPADDRSAVAISGTAGMAIELTKLFQTEIEHYEKIEGARLSLDGKANYLARMVRSNLALAFQGLIVVPIFCGYDDATQAGKLYSYDVVGGRYDEQDYATTGSGGNEARAFLKGAWREGLSESDAIGVALEALIAAAEEDSATGGPDPKRGIYPNVVTVTGQGYREVEDEELAPLAAAAMEGRP